MQGNDYNRLRTFYHSLIDANRALRLPPGGTTAENNLTKDLVRGTCLFANLALVHIATGVVDSAKDTFSSRSYHQMQQAIEPKTQELTTSILNQAKTLKISPTGATS